MAKPKFDPDQYYTETIGEGIHLYEQNGRFFSTGEGHQEMRIVREGGINRAEPVHSTEPEDAPNKIEKPAKKPKAAKAAKPARQAPNLDPADDDDDKGDDGAIDLVAWAKEALDPMPQWLDVVRAYKAKYGEPPGSKAKAIEKILG